MQPVSVLSIAGSDSGGGAGIQADLRTFASYRVHGTTALTAVTAQNTVGVRDVVTLTPEQLKAQLDAVLDDFVIRAVKTGMLATAALVRVVGDYASRGLLPRLVVDPVLVSSTNHHLLGDGGVDAYREYLLPHTDVLTPNLREAAVLGGVDARDVTTIADMVELGRRLLGFGPRFVVMKGGHFASDVQPAIAPDVLVSDDAIWEFPGERVDTANDHGTGCSLSAALCSLAALDVPVPEALGQAKQFVRDALVGASTWRLGAGRGPIDHLKWNHDH